LEPEPELCPERAGFFQKLGIGFFQIAGPFKIRIPGKKKSQNPHYFHFPFSREIFGTPDQTFSWTFLSFRKFSIPNGVTS